MTIVRSGARSGKDMDSSEFIDAVGLQAGQSSGQSSSGSGHSSPQRDVEVALVTPSPDHPQEQLDMWDVIMASQTR